MLLFVEDPAVWRRGLCADPIDRLIRKLGPRHPRGLTLLGLRGGQTSVPLNHTALLLHVFRHLLIPKHGDLTAFIFAASFVLISSCPI